MKVGQEMEVGEEMLAGCVTDRTVAVKIQTDVGQETLAKGTKVRLTVLYLLIYRLSYVGQEMLAKEMKS